MKAAFGLRFVFAFLGFVAAFVTFFFGAAFLGFVAFLGAFLALALGFLGAAFLVAFFFFIAI
jgi:hypothetical protein